MLPSAITSGVIAAIAAILAFAVFTGTAAVVFQVIFWVALVVFALTLISYMVQGRQRTAPAQ